MAKIEAFYHLLLQESPIRQSPTDQRDCKSPSPAEVPARDWGNKDKNLQMNTSERVRGTSDFTYTMSLLGSSAEGTREPFSACDVSCTGR